MAILIYTFLASSIFSNSFEFLMLIFIFNIIALYLLTSRYER
jgi:hypothetical protein